MVTKAQADNCVTHHHACDCREYETEQTISQLREWVKEAQAKNQKALARNVLLANERNAYSNENGELRERLKALETNLTFCHETLTEADEKVIPALEQRVEALEQRVEALEGEKTRLLDAIDKHLRGSWTLNDLRHTRSHIEDSPTEPNASRGVTG